MSVKVRQHRGAWWVFVNHQGARKSKRCGSEAAARGAARDIELALSRSDFSLPTQPKKETFKAYAERWLPTAGIKASTRRFYGANLARYIYPVVGNVQVGHLKREHTKKLIQALVKRGLAGKTVTGIIRTFSTVCSEAYEDGRLVVHPALKPGRLRRLMADPDAPKAAEIDPYTREEAAALVEAARVFFPGWHAFVLTALRTGLRLGELRALEWDDLDFKHDFIQVARNFVEGKTTTPKSGHQRRVDMSAGLKVVLQDHRRQQAAKWLQRKVKKGAQPKPVPTLVFPSRLGNQLDDANIRTAIRLISTKAGVRKRPRPVHVFRHTFGSLLVQQGESLVYVKEQMGHSSIQVTVDHYARFMPGGNRGAVNKLDAEKAGS